MTSALLRSVTAAAEAMQKQQAEDCAEKLAKADEDKLCLSAQLSAAQEQASSLDRPCLAAVSSLTWTGRLLHCMAYLPTAMDNVAVPPPAQTIEGCRAVHAGGDLCSSGCRGWPERERAGGAVQRHAAAAGRAGKCCTICKI